MKLMISAATKLLAGLVLVGALVFLPAGTWNYPNGWLFLGVLFVPIFLLGVVLLIKSPALLRRRLDGKEKEATQKGVVAASGLIFLVGFVLCGLDFRFGWSVMPSWVPVAAAVAFLAGYGVYAEVMRENADLSRTIKVEEGQTVVDSGLYGVIRHPMYAATVLLFLSIPLMLGSWYGAIVFLAYPPVIALRIRNEEKVLAEQLEGYEAYKQKVKYRLIPFIW